MKRTDKNLIKQLQDYFQKEPSVLLAFLFGSYAQGYGKEESDLDIAVYLKDYSPYGFRFQNPPLKERRIEKKIYLGTGRLAEKSVDLVVLNIAPASLISNVFKTGIPLAVKDKRLYWELYLKASSEAEDFLPFVADYWEIYKRSSSLTTEDKERVLQRWQFLDSELQEIEEFKKLSFDEYTDDRNKRRSIERWTETIINAAIDIAKIVLASEKQAMPRSYESALFYFALLAGLDKDEADDLAHFAGLRNIIAHEYLEVIYNRIRNFIKEFPPLYKKISVFLEKYLKTE